MLEGLRKHLKNRTPEQVKKDKEFFEKHRNATPKGWNDINDHLPMWMACDVGKGFSEYKVRFADGSEGTTRVTDHQSWKYFAQEVGITHWLKE